MSKELLNAMIASNGNDATTCNGTGDLVYKTTTSNVLDFFSKISAMRFEKESTIINLFTKAFNEDKLLALKALFYNRDIRGGQGERFTTRVILKYLASFYPEIIKNNIECIVEYGRYDDLYELFDTPSEKYAVNLIKYTLLNDIDSDNPSLLAKWLKSENASSEKTKILAIKTRKALNSSSKEYRKMLTKLRNKINIIETLMCTKQYSNIEYNKIPSKAGLMYRKAFLKRDELRYKEFIESLMNKTKTVNVKDLYPYEILYNLRMLFNNRDIIEINLLNSMWNSLPDYYPKDSNQNMLAVIDTSGSMESWSYYSNTKNTNVKYKPIDIAISIGLYIAERNNGPFKDYYINFNSVSKLYKFEGNSLYEKFINAKHNNDWGGNTNLHSTFELILNAAKTVNLEPEKMVKKLIVISDMQINGGSTYSANDNKIINMFKNIYNQNGYKLPEIIFWNVNSTNQNFSLATKNESNITLISGFNPNILKTILSGENGTPYSQMLTVLNDERYDMIKI